MNIIWTNAARDDLLEIREYLTEQIRDEVGSLKDWPAKGIYVKELEELQLDQYRELLTGQHRIIFERASDAFYIHIVCHTSRDLESLLRRRLLAV
jgi:plasmid stabilization system protein ParE